MFMDLAEGMQQYGFLAMVALAVGGLLFAMLFPYFSGAKRTEKRVRALAGDKVPVKQGLRARLMTEDPKDARRKQLQESLNQVGERERQRRQKMTLRVMLMQSGLEISPRLFYALSLVLGLPLVCRHFGWSGRLFRLAALGAEIPAPPPATDIPQRFRRCHRHHGARPQIGFAAQ
jgi:hypothetical protein